jgi:hypothetical protein
MITAEKRLICQGEFGVSVAHMLEPHGWIITGTADMSTIESGNIVGMVSIGAADALLLELDNICKAKACRLYAVRVIGRHLIAGPTMGNGAICYQCVRRRVLAQSTHPSRTLALWDFERELEEGGIVGFTPAMRQMAAASLQSATERDCANMSWFDTVTGDYACVRPVAISGCRCSTIGTDTDKFISAMTTLLE